MRVTVWKLSTIKIDGTDATQDCCRGKYYYNNLIGFTRQINISAHSNTFTEKFLKVLLHTSDNWKILVQQRQNQKHLCMESMNIALIRCTCFSTSAPAPVPNHNKRFACLSFKEFCYVSVSGCERTSKATCGRRTVRCRLWLATSLLPTPRQSCLLRTHMIFGIDRICSSLTRSLPELFLA